MHDIWSRRTFLTATSAAAAWAVTGRGRAAEMLPSGKDLVVRSAAPLNAEPRLADLVAAAQTPLGHFYVRSHGPVPLVDTARYRLTVEGLVHKRLELSLGELKERFRAEAVETTLTCAGNRRQEMSAERPVSGLQWDAGAIGNGRFQGPRLADVLQAAGIQADAKHVWFEGLDPITEKDGSVAPFGGSIPLEKAMARDGESLVALEMNGAALAPEHGFPVRTVVPGYIGARSVKWLAKIVVSDRPSPNHYVAEAYKVVQSDSKEEAARKDPIYAYPINAAICTPAAGAMLKAGRVTVRGYALASGEPGCTVQKVEVSADGGRSWQAARLEGEGRPFVWQLWSLVLDLPAGKHTLAVRATDSQGHSMPQRAEWNFKGYLYNGWHRVHVEAG